MISRLAFALAALVALPGCATLYQDGFGQRQGNSSSLVDFLYPDGEIPPTQTGLPTIELPATVGLAFVPANGRETLSAAEKQELLERVRAAFSDRPFVDSIVVIPDAYLRRKAGVTGMQQAARMFEADVMALVSYDQLSISAERDSSLLYWTVVGALVVKGNSNEVQTMIDTAVFDVNSARLLFRAPGVARDRRNATLIDNATDLRALRVEGFSVATDDMVTNLDTELGQFREAVENGRRANVRWSGGGGGGSTGLAVLALLALAAGYRRWSAC